MMAKTTRFLRDLEVFPLEHIDNYLDSVPSKWINHGGVMMPMLQSKAMRIDFIPEYIMELAVVYYS